MGPIETSISGTNHVVLHAQNDRRGLGPIEISVVMHKQITRRSLGPIETCKSVPKVAVLQAKSTDESWDP